ncbi:hypothetical protein AVEN_135105-1 [Araneus ventricosus]|uniref:Uncharacterized protein n=1 Tax=Araneus ventricosus TaxID=182803 RepID=A0A4Y2JL41_ARAVE|nr:hypothetical protein AVEN_135105-1 [Araneus ventricosus]
MTPEVAHPLQTSAPGRLAHNARFSGTRLATYRRIFSGIVFRAWSSPAPMPRPPLGHHTVTNMESRFPAMLVLWLGTEFYKVKHGVKGSDCSGIPDLGEELGDYFGDLATNLATLATNR